MNLYKLILLLILNALFFIPLQGQSLHFNIPETDVFQGDTVRLRIKTADFNNIVSVQYSINWDFSIAQYLSNEQVDLEDVAIGDVMAANGELRVSWFDIAGNGVTLPDSSIFIDLLFLGIGDIGTMTDVLISETPLAIQLFRDSMGVNVPLVLDADQGSVTIIEPEVLQVTAEIIEVLCHGDSTGSISPVVTGAPENISFNWIGPYGFTATTQNIENLSSGLYSLSILNESGSTIHVESFIVIQPANALGANVLDAQDSDCDAATGSILFEPIGGTAPFLYDIGEGAQNNPEFTALEIGDYQLTIIDGNGCSATERFAITSPDGPVVDLGEDLELCEGEALDLEAGIFDNYQWNNGEEVAQISVETSGIYAVTVSDEANCTASDEITVTFLPGIDLVVETDSVTVCPGTTVKLEAFGGTNYEWFAPEGGLLNPDGLNPFVAPEEETEYTVISSNDCDVDTANIKVGVFDVIANAGRDSCIALGTDAQLNATGALSYQWLNTEFTLNDYSIPDPISTPTDSTFYVVVMQDENDCLVTDSVYIAVATDPLEFLIPINTITPNGDGKNDVLVFQGIRKFPANALKIYNRWGDLVFQKVNYQKDELRFDGTHNGNLLPAGTYYYILTFQNDELRQTLTIVRE